jgi:hypothetical protein
MAGISGPLFLSHSTRDAALLDTFAGGLRTCLAGRVRLFNTSELVLRGGRDWRAQVLAGIRGSHVLLLLATSRTFDSNEVCFELGAAAAYGQPVIPCCVGLSPAGLRLGLDNLQAFDVTTKRGWAALINELAIVTNYTGAVDETILEGLSDAMSGGPDLVVAVSRGRTLEVTNLSDKPLLSVTSRLVDEAQRSWLDRLSNVSLEPTASIVVVRPPDDPEAMLEITWATADGGGSATFPLPEARR